MGFLFNLAILGIVAIGFLKVGGGDFLNRGFSSAANINKQVRDVFDKEKAGNEAKASDRNLEDV